MILRDWVRSLKESAGKSRALMQKMTSESVTKNSVKGSRDGAALGLKVETAVTVRANDTESTDKSGNERSRSNSDPRCQGNTITSRAEKQRLITFMVENYPSWTRKTSVKFIKFSFVCFSSRRSKNDIWRCFRVVTRPPRLHQSTNWHILFL